MRYITILMLALAAGCKTNVPMAQSSKGEEKAFTPQYIPGPHILVYRTRSDYNKLVPVLLSEDKKTLVSYPSPADLKKGDVYQTPALLHKGFLLDNRGINGNAAFLRLTYEQYAAQGVSYSLEELYNLIQDKDPIVELYDCGIRDQSKDTEELVNRLIDNGSLSKTCRKLK
jgi:hypothetical protein